MTIEISDLRVCTLILTYRNPGNAKKCADSVLKLSEVLHSIFLINNGANTDIDFIASDAYKSIEVISPPKNLGYAGGFNFGIKAALKENNFDYFFLVTDDVELEPDCLSILFKCAEQNPNFAFIGPESFSSRQRDKHDNWVVSEKKSSNFDPLLDFGFDNEGSYPHGKAISVYFASGHCMLVRRDAIKNIGLMRPNFFIYYEEFEWQLRAKFNFKYESAVVPGAVTYHPRESFSNPFNAYLRSRNFLLLSRIIDQEFKRLSISQKISHRLALYRQCLSYIAQKKPELFLNSMKGIAHGEIQKTPKIEYLSD